MSRVAVVAGAGSGIGAAIARTLSERGMHVVATDLDEDAARRTASACADASARRLDVTDAAAAREIADSVADEHGALDGWVSKRGRLRDEAASRCNRSVATRCSRSGATSCSPPAAPSTTATAR